MSGTTIPEDQRGFLVPAHFVVFKPSEADMLVSTALLGFSLAAGVYSSGLAWSQTKRVLRRNSRWNAYVAMIWTELVASIAMSIISWLFIHGDFPISFQLWFILVSIWVVQIQCITGIMVNRISLLMVSRRKAAYLQLWVACIIGVINVVVFIVLIPSHLQISQTWIVADRIWDRCAKGVFAIVDLSLNLYFIRLVYTKLIAAGLTKYLPLFRFNIVIGLFSVSLDLILIGSMSISYGFVYAQFHPLVYLLKLHIEMVMAELIRKVASADPNNNRGGYALSPRAATGSGPGTNNRTASAAATDHLDSKGDDDLECSGAGRDDALGPYNASVRAEPIPESKKTGNGITRIVQTTITSRRRSIDRGDESSQSSTRKLKDLADEYYHEND